MLEGVKLECSARTEEISKFGTALDHIVPNLDSVDLLAQKSLDLQKIQDGIEAVKQSRFFCFEKIEVS